MQNLCRDSLVEAHAPMAGYAPRSALLSFVVMFQSNYYFSSSVPFFQIPESFRDLTQTVAPVDDRCYLSSCHKLSHDSQILFVRSRNEGDQLLAHERGEHKSSDQADQKIDHSNVVWCSDHD